MKNKKGKGKRAKTRYKFTRKKAALTVSMLLREFDVGSRVHIKVDSAVHSGLPFKRFIGATGTVVGLRGKKGVLVKFKDQNKEKQLIVHPAHLQLAGGSTPKTK